MSDLSALLAFAHRLADAAALETMPLFRAALEIDNKLGEDGFDPVTHADRNTEAAIRTLITQEFPDHGILGEEFDEKPPAGSGGGFCWVIDPIDGTRAFVSGMPSWGTLIALSQNGVPVLGIMDQPYVGERFCAVRGGTALHLRAGKRRPFQHVRAPRWNRQPWQPPHPNCSSAQAHAPPGLRYQRARASSVMAEIAIIMRCWPPASSIL